VNAILPPVIDNVYRGSKAGLWIFIFVLLIKTLMSVNSIINAPAVASTADGIPLATFPAGAASTIVSLFALQAMSRLVFCIFGVLVLVRYRSMVPMMYVLLLFEHLARRAILYFNPIPHSEASSGNTISLVLLAVMTAGFLFSLWHRHGREM
jgi:hypothetical protein